MVRGLMVPELHAMRMFSYTCSFIHVVIGSHSLVRFDRDISSQGQMSFIGRSRTFGTAWFEQTKPMVTWVD